MFDDPPLVREELMKECAVVLFCIDFLMDDVYSDVFLDLCGVFMAFVDSGLYEFVPWILECDGSEKRRRCVFDGWSFFKFASGPALLSALILFFLSFANEATLVACFGYSGTVKDAR